MISVLFVILEDLHTLRKNFKRCIPQNVNNYMWIKNLFTANLADFVVRFSSGFQEQLIDLKSDSSLKLSFGGLSLPKFQTNIQCCMKKVVKYQQKITFLRRCIKQNVFAKIKPKKKE